MRKYAFALCNAAGVLCAVQVGTLAKLGAGQWESCVLWPLILAPETNVSRLGLLAPSPGSGLCQGQVCAWGRASCQSHCYMLGWNKRRTESWGYKGPYVIATPAPGVVACFRRCLAFIEVFRCGFPTIRICPCPFQPANLPHEPWQQLYPGQ